MAGTGKKFGKRNKRRSSLREESEQRRIKREAAVSLKGLIIRFAIVVAVFAVIYAIFINSQFKIEKFIIEGNKHIPTEDIISLSGLEVEDRLFGNDLSAAEHQILLHVMIDDVNVRVRPFHTVYIQLTEKDVVAGFTVDDTYFYMDGNKVIAGEATEVDESLPLIRNVESQSFVSIGAVLTDEFLDDDLEIVNALGDRFANHFVEVDAQTSSVNTLYIDGVEYRLGPLNRLKGKLDMIADLIHSVSPQKLESLEYVDVSVGGEPVLKELPVGMTKEEYAEAEAEKKLTEGKNAENAENGKKTENNAERR